MPVTVKKANGGYQVSTPNIVHAKRTSFEKAMAQKRLLNAVDHGGKPTGKKIKSYEYGGVVEKTGPAYLHRGERVIPPDGLRKNIVDVDPYNLGVDSANTQAMIEGKEGGYKKKLRYRE